MTTIITLPVAKPTTTALTMAKTAIPSVATNAITTALIR